MSWRPKLRRVLPAAAAAGICLVVIGLGAIRLYQNELVRRTESELVAQGTMVQASYKQLLLEQLHVGPTPESGPPPRPLDEYAVAADIDWNKKIENWLKPEPLHVGFYPGPMHSRAPEPRDATEPADSQAMEAGRRLSEQLREANRLNRASVHVVDFKGTVVATTDGAPGKSLLHRTEISQALHGTFVQMLRHRPKEPSHATSGPRPTGARFEVCIAMPVAEEGRLLGAVLLSKAPIRVSTALSKSPTLAWGLLGAVLLALLALGAAAHLFSATRNSESRDDGDAPST